MFVAHRSSGSSESSGRDEVASPRIQFVAGNFSVPDADDEDLFGFPAGEDATFRSSPSPNLMAASPMFEVRRDEPCLVHECHTERTVRGAPSPAPVHFSSLADDFPLAGKSKHLAHPLPLSANSKPCFKQDREAEALPAASCLGKQPVKHSFDSHNNININNGSIRMDHLLNSMTDVTQADQMTVIMEPATERMDQDTLSQRTVADGEKANAAAVEEYMYHPIKQEHDEMESMRYQLLQQQFSRRSALVNNYTKLGYLEVQNNRVFFHPGSRRAAVTSLQHLHEAASSSAGEAAYLQMERLQFEAKAREFYCEETRHKQAIMLDRLETISPFNELPVLANRFLLVRLRGKGGNGEVWDTIDYADNKRSCALKLSTSVKHAQREHYTHSKLFHSHIASVGDSSYLIKYREVAYTAFTVERAYSDLQQLLEEQETFAEVYAVQILCQLLDALCYLHDDMNLAHYDVKPSNILISPDGNVKLTDFDLARPVRASIVSSSVGTLRYLPPECFRPNFGNCGATAEKADIWMVGIVYYLTLFGKHPVCNDKMTPEEAKVTLGRFRGELQYPTPVADISRWICQSCLHPDPRCRPTASQLLIGLRMMLEQLQSQQMQM